tara:strand:+ start:1201 stop:2319 length:1119 start_codon:yes stop_codon:yes gene_type:complete
MKKYGSRKEVFNNIALKTTGGLYKSDLMLNKRNKIVSIKKHNKAILHYGGHKVSNCMNTLFNRNKKYNKYNPSNTYLHYIKNEDIDLSTLFIPDKIIDEINEDLDEPDMKQIEGLPDKYRLTPKQYFRRCIKNKECSLTDNFTESGNFHGFYLGSSRPVYILSAICNFGRLSSWLTQWEKYDLPKGVCDTRLLTNLIDKYIWNSSRLFTKNKTVYIFHDDDIVELSRTTYNSNGLHTLYELDIIIKKKLYEQNNIMLVYNLHPLIKKFIERIYLDKKLYPEFDNHRNKSQIKFNKMRKAIYASKLIVIMALCSYGRIDLAKEIEYLWSKNKIEEIQQKYNEFKEGIYENHPKSTLNRLLNISNQTNFSIFNS